jgi:general secretion pathway protein B
MSYILDALRRAEADREREKSAVPGLHSQPVAAAPSEAIRRPAAALRWGGAAFVVITLLGAAWWGLRGESGGRPAAPPAPAADAASTEAATGRVAASPPLPATATATEAEAVRLPEPAPARVVVPAHALSPAPAIHDAPAAATAARPVAAASTSTSTTASLPALPADLRLVAGGSIWSDTPSSRMLILNGQVFHEGEHPAPDVTLEKIGPKSAVLVVRGGRYLLTY